MKNKCQNCRHFTLMEWGSGHCFIHDQMKLALQTCGAFEPKKKKEES